MSAIKGEFPDQKQRVAVCMNQWRKEKEGKAMAIAIERRAFPIEFRVEGDEQPKIRGYAAVFNKMSDVLGGFREKIAPGAFKKTLKEADVRALFNHDPNFVLGRTSSGTLALREDDKGLFMEIDPPDTAPARDLMTLIERGDVDQASFAFRVVKDTWEHEESQTPTRTLNEVVLYDVSPVTYPAYPQTSVDVRSLLVLNTTDSNEIRELLDVLNRSEPGDHSEEPAESHSDEPDAAHSEEESVKVREFNVLLQEWRLEVEAGR